MNYPLFIFEKNRVQRAIELDIAKERELLATGWTHIATIDPMAYLLYEINNNGMRVEK
jgi:hypothetical protein